MAITLRDYQEGACRGVQHHWRKGDKRVLVSMPTGTGKCARPDTLVWSNGLWELGELQAAGVSEIHTPAGLRRIEGWHDDGVRCGLCLTTECGMSIDGTLEHRVWVRTHEAWEGWRKLCELRGDEFIAVARGQASWGTWTCSDRDAERLGRQWVPERNSKLRQPLPEQILRASRRVVAAFMRGVFGAKGYQKRYQAVWLPESTAKKFQILLLGLGVWSSCHQAKKCARSWCVKVRDIEAFDEHIGRSIFPPRWNKDRKASREAYRSWVASVRVSRTNTDVVPGTSHLIRSMRRVARRSGTGADPVWAVAPSYYGHERERGGYRRCPSRKMLKRMVQACPPCPARTEVERLLSDNYAWSPVKHIRPSTAHRIDCSVQGEHCYVGNGFVNHNTWLFVFLTYAVLQNGIRTVILVNTDELVNQTVEKLERVGVYPGVIKAGRNEWNKEVVVASVQTLSKATRLFNLPPNHFGFLIVDECHYANAPSYQRIMNYFRDAWMLGVTATPFRGDKKSLAGAGWDAVAYVFPLKRAIDEGWLAPVQFHVVKTQTEIKGVSTSRATLTSEKDYSAKALEKLVDTPERNQKIVEASLRHLVVRDGAFVTRFRRTIAFCAGVQHAVNLANAFRAKGVEAFAIYGSLKPKHRRILIKGHRKGLFPVMCNCNILTHGYDDPEVSGLIMARPTKSKVLYLQQLGRGLRIDEQDPGKTCVVLDVADVASKHDITIGRELLDLEEELEERHRDQPAEEVDDADEDEGDIPGEQVVG